jgi:hypothetical protein
MMGGGGKGSNKPPANTSQERAAAEVALKRYQRYMDVYRPMENAAIADVIGDQSGQRIERWAGGRLNADAAQTMAAAAPGQGRDPSGQMVQGGIMNTQRAAAIGSAAAEQAGLGRKQKISGLSAAIGIGTGQAKEAQLAFNDLAGSSLERSIKQQELDFNSRADRLNTYGSAIGAATSFGANTYNEQKKK